MRSRAAQRLRMIIKSRVFKSAMPTCCVFFTPTQQNGNYAVVRYFPLFGVHWACLCQNTLQAKEALAQCESMHLSLRRVQHDPRPACIAFEIIPPWSSYQHLMSRVWTVIPQNAPMWMCGLLPPRSRPNTRNGVNVLQTQRVAAQNDCRCAPHFCRKLIARARWCCCKAFNYIFRRCLTNVIFFPPPLLSLPPLSLPHLLPLLAVNHRAKQAGEEFPPQPANQ